jgi:uncharacterized tellurite resistance protein B-like protein
MLDTLRKLIADSLPVLPPSEPPLVDTDLRVTAGALLLRMAYADEYFAPEERQLITQALTTHFGVDTRGALELVEAAGGVLHTGPSDATLAAQLAAAYDADQRLMLADLIWDVAHADGVADRHEAFLANKLEHWLQVKRPGANAGG